MAAEQKARVTYDNLLRATNDPDIIKPLTFLREREIVHFQRFGEALEDVYKRQVVPARSPQNTRYSLTLSNVTSF